MQKVLGVKSLTMHLKTIANLMSRSKVLPVMYDGCRCLNVVSYDHSEELDDEVLPAEWYKLAYPTLIKLSCALKNIDRIDGRLTNIDDNSTVRDDYTIREMDRFKSLASAFIGSPAMQRALKKAASSTSEFTTPSSCCRKQKERNSMTLDSLTKVCNFLNVSAQQRKSIRLTVCPQVTQHHIWRGALEEVLQNLKFEMSDFKHRSQAFKMGEQIVSSCVKFLTDTANPSHHETPLWMQLASTKKANKPTYLRKWVEALEMFEDLSKCLGKEEWFTCHLSKIEVMKEGLYQIKEVLVEREIGYKEARRQDCLVQKKLSKSLGHSSKCLFTLLLYYLHGSVRDIEVEVCGFCRSGGDDRYYLSVGKILTSDNERMMWSALKQLDRAIGLFEFVWKTAGMKGVLELEGHLWCVGAEERSLTYRGNMFFVHGFKL